MATLVPAFSPLRNAPAPLAAFIGQVGSLIAEADEALLLPAVTTALATLVAQDNWLPPEYAQPHPEHYTQYLLHSDPGGRFSVVSFVWGPGQGTPVHDHKVWGVVGVLRGSERAQHYTVSHDSPPRALDVAIILHAGNVEAVSPRIGDIHQVANADDGVTVSIHVYGADIGSVSRHIYPVTGGARRFISGYANTAATPAFR